MNIKVLWIIQTSCSVLFRRYKLALVFHKVFERESDESREASIEIRLAKSMADSFVVFSFFCVCVVVCICVYDAAGHYVWLIAKTTDMADVHSTGNCAVCGAHNEKDVKQTAEVRCLVLGATPLRVFIPSLSIANRSLAHSLRLFKRPGKPLRTYEPTNVSASLCLSLSLFRRASFFLTRSLLRYFKTARLYLSDVERSSIVIIVLRGMRIMKNR